MFNLERKKSVKLEEKGPTKRFSYDLRGRKRLDQEIEKELSFLTSRDSETSAKKRSSTFFCSGVQRKWLWFVFNLYSMRKTRFVCEFFLDKLSTRETSFTHKWKICNFRILGYFANLTCLNVSVSDFLFFTKNHPTSAKLFCVWFQSQSWFSFFCLVLWKVLCLGCKVVFCSVFRLTEN